MDLMLAMAPLPCWEEGTATGAIVNQWREICRGVQEGRGEMRGGGENERERWAGIYANPSPFHRDWDRIPFKPTLPKKEFVLLLLEHSRGPPHRSLGKRRRGGGPSTTWVALDRPRRLEISSECLAG